VTFAVGSLVRARGREWVVLPESEGDLLVVRPLGGADEEIAGLWSPLETVESAQFALPDPSRPGDFRSCRLLRDAVRLGFRASAGPFRSFGRIGVAPRPYQLVPLLMALKLDPVRLLIADDVGIGKTIEAGLIVRELIDRGEAKRFAVLCPPHLAEQWQKELAEKFHLETELVLSGTAARLERKCRVGQSLFEVYPQVVVSMDFIRAERRQHEFLRTCPELVVIDEAHTCAFDDRGRSGQHLRHELVKGLAAEPRRNMILVTATPHSGKAGAFRSLLAFLNPDFASLPDDLTGRELEPQRRRLAAHFVQRRRGDIRHFLKAETPFPERMTQEETYTLSPEYKALFERVLAFARESIKVPGEDRRRQRVRWWAAIALLRSLGSSPRAAAATLRSRANVAETETPEEADELGVRSVLDSVEDSVEATDVEPGSEADEFFADAAKTTRLRRELARQADALEGDKDRKLVRTAELVKGLVKQGRNPIVFCRFIATAEYVAEELRKRLAKDIEIEAVTSRLNPEDRQLRVAALAKRRPHVLVATDCLSEGINLQEHFDAVLHYDLAWNPTRHEQREGRVDRYGQPQPTVQVVTLWGRDNGIDGLVLQILLEKHGKIRSSTGVSVPVPIDTNQVVEAILEGLLLKGLGDRGENLELFEDFFRPEKEKLYLAWDAAADREKRSRTMFAQESIKPDEVAIELAEVQKAVGSAGDVEHFTIESLTSLGAQIRTGRPVRIDIKECPRPVKDAMSGETSLTVAFGLPVPEGVTYLSRAHPWVSALAGLVMDQALDPNQERPVAARAGVARTQDVARRTTLLVLRLRHQLVSRRGPAETVMLSEESRLLAFEGSPEGPVWLPEEDAERLLEARPSGNVHADQAKEFLLKVLEGIGPVRDRLESFAQERAEALYEAHRRVRQAAGIRGLSERVVPLLPVDVLGLYVLLPAG
jgi:superfamily II DNA or RNA helicase